MSSEGEQPVKLISSDNVEIVTGMRALFRFLPHSYRAPMLTLSFQSAESPSAAC